MKAFLPPRSGRKVPKADGGTLLLFTGQSETAPPPSALRAASPAPRGKQEPGLRQLVTNEDFPSPAQRGKQEPVLRQFVTNENFPSPAQRGKVPKADGGTLLLFTGQSKPVPSALRIVVLATSLWLALRAASAAHVDKPADVRAQRGKASALVAFIAATRPRVSMRALT
jgi:hypothetical protein